ncbi:IclR family transcriptional regulator, partial [Brucella melitensis]
FLGTALPFVRQLAERTGETVHLSEFSNGRLSTIHVEESPRAHRVFINVGMILPFHATASGLAYLAACADDVVEATVTKSLDTFTEFTIADPEEVRRRVREARQNGFSVNRQGLEVGVMSTSAAILTPGSRPVGCITVAAPLARADDGIVMRYGADAHATAEAISAALFAEHRQARSNQSKRNG